MFGAEDVACATLIFFFFIVSNFVSSQSLITQNRLYDAGSPPLAPNIQEVWCHSLVYFLDIDPKEVDEEGKNCKV